VKNSLLALAMSVALSMSAAANAQTTQLKVAVPFDFMAGDTVLPAGDYDVQSTDTWGGKALSIHNVTSNAGTLILSDSCQMAKTSDSNKLVFYRYATDISSPKCGPRTPTSVERCRSTSDRRSWP